MLRLDLILDNDHMHGGRLSLDQMIWKLLQVCVGSRLLVRLMLLDVLL